MSGPGPSTGYSPVLGIESKESSPFTVSTDSGPVDPLPNKLQKVMSDASGRTKAVASLPVKEKGASRANSSVGDSRGKASSSIRKDEGSGGPKATIRKDEGVDPQTAPIPISDGDDNVITVADSTISSSSERRARKILLQKRAERLRAEEALAEAELEEVKAAELEEVKAELS